MTNRKTDSTTARPDLDPGLAELRGDCARMAPRWTPPASTAGRAVPPGPAHVLPHGVTVPGRSARLLEAMSEYGD
ncbi:MULTISPECIES: hypothetical protein [unclassified Streptomyces]|uniref:hypothetical protein n=1 Tax=unclassified Streptomyces TaxID=2593676 RepID=UPI0022382885|nr:hypothetical protein [Streptomyces sp. SHP 1-2]MCW5249239.1 hypothetical protein [Streptomyces sp. SHP 1-2]